MFIEILLSGHTEEELKLRAEEIVCVLERYKRLESVTIYPLIDSVEGIKIYPKEMICS